MLVRMCGKHSHELMVAVRIAMFSKENLDEYQEP